MFPKNILNILNSDILPNAQTAFPSMAKEMASFMFC